MVLVCTIYAGEDLPESFDDEPVQPVTNQQKPLSKSELDLGVKDISTAPDESALRQFLATGIVWQSLQMMKMH